MTAETNLVFLDTNILLYAHDLSAVGKEEIAKNLIRDCWQSEKGCLSIQVLQEFFVNATRKIPKPIAYDTAKEIIADLSQWRVHTPVAADVLQAIDLHERYQISFWDALIIQSAEVLGCETVFSEDLNPGQVYGSVRVQNPFA